MGSVQARLLKRGGQGSFDCYDSEDTRGGLFASGGGGFVETAKGEQLDMKMKMKMKLMMKLLLKLL